MNFASSHERDIALDIIDMCIGYGLMEVYNNTEKYKSFYDWYTTQRMDDRGLDFSDGATKVVFFSEELKNWVIKTNYPGVKEDYCNREYENYTLAEEAGLAEYFAATEYLCERNGITFYLQQKAYCDEGVDCDLVDVLQDRYENSHTPYDKEALYEEVEEMDSVDRVELLYGNFKLCDFIAKRRINDLHCGNFGLVENRYVMIDFSGFGRHIWGE